VLSTISAKAVKIAETTSMPRKMMVSHMEMMDATHVPRLAMVGVEVVRMVGCILMLRMMDVIIITIIIMVMIIVAVADTRIAVAADTVIVREAEVVVAANTMMRGVIGEDMTIMHMNEEINGPLQRPFEVQFLVSDYLLDLSRPLFLSS
jgi:hypothetical protein